MFLFFSELLHKNLLISIPSHKPPSDTRRNRNMKVLQPKVVINKLNAVKIESMDVDSDEVKIEEVPPIIPKLDNSTISEPVAVISSGVVTNHAIKKSATLKKVGKDSPRKILLTKGRPLIVFNVFLIHLHHPLLLVPVHHLLINGWSLTI